MDSFDKSSIRSLINKAFEEDIRSGDITTNAIVGESEKAEAVWIAKDDGIIAGLNIARLVFEMLDSKVTWIPKINDGDKVSCGKEILKIKGAVRVILTAERVALNIAQRMCGIATATSKFVAAVDSYSTQILDTRKTVPGLRLLDKYAVKAGGGMNHRMGLYDLAMIKDNHIAAAGSIEVAVRKVRKNNPDIQIEVETSTIDQVKEALSVWVDIIMLDNMNLDQMEKAVGLINGRAKTEASGNMTLDRIQNVAKTGVDFISVGELTHSVKAFDISQKIKKIYN